DLAQALVSPGRAERRADLDRRAQRDSPGKPRRGRAAPPYRSGVSGISPVGAPQRARQCRARGASRRRVPARQPHQSLSAAARARPQRALRCAPTGNVDDEAAEEIMKLLLRMRERGATIVIATHDRRMIERYGTRVLRLEQGALIRDLARAAEP